MIFLLWEINIHLSSSLFWQYQAFIYIWRHFKDPNGAKKIGQMQTPRFTDDDLHSLTLLSFHYLQWYLKCLSHLELLS